MALIPSICILRTVGGMRFVATKVPGVDVPDEIVRRVEEAGDAENECFDIAHELATHALSMPGVAGLHFISFRKDAGHREALHPPRHSAQTRKGNQWIQCFGRGLRP